MTGAPRRVRRMTLPRSDCLARLRQAVLARVIISVRCLPAALPARIAVTDDHHLLLASTEDAVIAAAQRGDVLSVQIDGLEDDGATWSVMGSGIAALPETETATTLSEALTRAVAAGARLIELPLTVVSGERVG
ncbi:MAG: pyridoxamine 5'-phosphate oxidase family protein [Acidimicrobiales bacterium]